MKRRLGGKKKEAYATCQHGRVKLPPVFSVALGGFPWVLDFSLSLSAGGGDRMSQVKFTPTSENSRTASIFRRPGFSPLPPPLSPGFPPSLSKNAWK